MGLDLRVQDRDGNLICGERMSSYTGFHDFRVAWARLLGFDLEKMEGFGGKKSWTEEPLQCFFRHSDCEGELPWRDAEEILAQARKDAPKLPEWRLVERLIRTCEASVETRMPIIFC